MLLSSKGCFLASYDIDYYLIDVLFIWYGLSYNKFKRSDVRLFLKFSIIFIVFMTVRYLFLNNVPQLLFFSDLYFLVKYVLLSFLYCAVLREEALNYIIKLTIIGAGVSLFFYGLQLISGNLVFFLGSIITLSPRSSNPDYSNFIVFTYDRSQGPRNSGFSWEPGAFGCMLNLGLLLYFYTNKFVFNKNVWILVIAIITTLSTTSYIALVFNLLIYYRANGGKYIKIFLLAVPVIVIAVVKVPFLLSKIMSSYYEDLAVMEKMDSLGAFYHLHGGQLPLNRFGSFIYLYNLFKEKLLWGVSNAYQDSTPRLTNVNISNGLIDFIAKFGLIGLIFLLYKYALLLKKLVADNELLIYSLLIIVILSFGEPLLIWQNIIAFLFLYHYTNPVDADVVDEEQDVVPQVRNRKLTTQLNY